MKNRYEDKLGNRDKAVGEEEEVVVGGWGEWKRRRGNIHKAAWKRPGRLMAKTDMRGNQKTGGRRQEIKPRASVRDAGPGTSFELLAARLKVRAAAPKRASWEEKQLEERRFSKRALTVRSWICVWESRGEAGAAICPVTQGREVHDPQALTYRK